MLIRKTTFLSLVAGGLLTCLAISVQARVLDLHIDERQVVAGGAPFGDRGAYERLRGTVTFSVDPADQLVSDGFLLPEDRDRVMARNQGLWDLITQRQERAP